MFGFFKKKPAEPDHENNAGEPIIAFLLVEGNTFPTQSLVSQLSKKKIAGKTAKDVKINEKDMVSFSLGKDIFAIGLMPAQYPMPELEGPMATSFLWPEQPSIESIRKHKTHLLISMVGGTADGIRRRLKLTAVTALAAQQKGVMAVYWGEATQLIHPPLFVSMANEINTPEAPPLYLWIDIRVFRNDDGTTGLFTTGFKHLGHMEIEIPSIDMEPGELREWIINIGYYLLEKGPVLLDGQTIGVSAEHKMKIRHRKSQFGISGKVICLMPQS